MKKNILASCLAVIALAGCSSDNCQDGQCIPGEDLSSHSQALFGETGGEPWGVPANQLAAPAEFYDYGRHIGTGMINADKKIDIISSAYDIQNRGTVTIHWDAMNETKKDDFNFSNSKDKFGAAIAVGKFCPELSKRDIIVASAPMYNYNAGAFGLIYASKSNRTRIYRRIVNTAHDEVAGAVLAVADIDNDEKNDLIFQTTPIDSNNEYVPEKAEIRVIRDFCSVNGNIDKYDVVKKGLLGSALYAVDLDKKGTTEIIVVNNLYSTNPDKSPNGAVYFYKLDGDQYVESRKPIIGDSTPTSGASIEAVAFSDIDGDGDLDLIVGEPMLNSKGKREGRVRTYTNNGGDFDPGVMAWSATPGRSNARFGSSVTISDVNDDGRDDLIVGAPGLTQSGIDKSQSYVYVYLGTKDGSVFSKIPYWTYNSNVPTTNNDDFGRRTAAADLDGKGWKDIIVGAPGNYSHISHIDIFMQSKAPCYTADQCMIDEKCYAAGALSDASKCDICDPKRNNFGFMPVQCDTTELLCKSAEVCDAEKGCIRTDKPDDTVCGESACDSPGSVTNSICKSGECVDIVEYCAPEQFCSPELRACVYECQTDTDCAAGQSCINYHCETVPAICTNDNQCADGEACRDGACVLNGLPVISLDASIDVAAGSTVQMPITVTDPDGDAFTAEWTGTGSVYLSDTAEIQPAIEIPAGTAAGAYPLTVTVTDSHGGVSTADTAVNVTPYIEPAECTVNEDCTPGEQCLDGKCTAIIGYCTTDADCGPGKKCADHLCIDIPGFCNADSDCAPGLVCRDAKCSANAAPVIDLVPEVTVTAGDRREMPITVTDPDGDSFTAAWSGTGSNLLDDTAAVMPTISIPDGTPVGTYDLTVKAVDAYGAASSAHTRIFVQPGVLPELAITNIKNGDRLYNTNVVFRGTAPAGGRITVYNDGDALCTAEIAGGKWECSSVLTEGTFSVTAIAAESGLKSDAVSFTVTPAPLISTPADGSSVQSPVAVSGKSVPGEITIVTVKAQGSDSDISSCNAVTNDDGIWVCPEITLKNGSYVVTASGIDDTFMTDISHFTVTGKPESHVAITAPADNANVKNRFVITGTAPDKAIVNVYNEKDSALICSAETAGGKWQCTPDIAPGSYVVAAKLSGSNYDGETSEAVSFTYTIDTIFITRPADGSTVDTHPEFAGRTDRADGIVSVWHNKDGISARLCTAEVTADGRWKCITENALLYDQTYTVTASWIDSEGSNDKPVYSAPVTFTTEQGSGSDIVILSPAPDSELSSNKPVIFTGTANPDTAITVHYDLIDSSNPNICTAMTNKYGRWACDDIILPENHYIAYAEATENPGNSSNVIKFSVVEGAPEENDQFYEMQGGSCSVTAVPASGNAAWIMLAAGFGALALLRRRRRA